LLKTAKLKYPQAAIEDLDRHSTRGLERSAVMSLALGEWVKAGYAVLITDATGAGKSWPANVLANYRHLCLSVAAWFEKGLAEGFGKYAVTIWSQPKAVTGVLSNASTGLWRCPSTCKRVAKDWRGRRHSDGAEAAPGRRQDQQRKAGDDEKAGI
jgi:hypothetical protein